MTLSNIIENKINEDSYGNVFIVSDFIDVAPYDTARKILSRLCEDGLIKKITRGMYYKPKYSSLLNEYVKPNMNLVADAFARNFGWTIIPSGETAITLLGLSTQVTSHYDFISSGPYRSYNINGIIISFSHRMDKEFNGLSYKSRLIIHAIKAIGNNQINGYINSIRDNLSNQEKSILLEETQRTTAWVYEVIKKICKGTN